MKKNQVRIVKALRPVVDAAIEQGWVVTSTKNGHLRFTHPCGALVHGASTPSDYRGIKNLQAQLRREYNRNNERNLSA